MTDKIVIITGSSSGIGEATAKLLASRGATVALAARRIDRLREIAAEIQANGGKAPSIRSTTSSSNTAGWTLWSTMPG